MTPQLGLAVRSRWGMTSCVPSVRTGGLVEVGDDVMCPLS